jgi:hypothetical protein
MKTTSLILSLTTAAAFSQGSLTPPGAPAPTQKSLQEIWDKIGAVEAQNLLLKSQLTSASLMDAVSPTGLALPWNLSTVDSVGSETSLAFGPDGHPAISYYDVINEDLKFARFNGSVWLIFAVDSAGNVGRFNSLAFGPDGQPAISYSGGNNNILKFARFNGNVWTITTIGSSGSGYWNSLAFGTDGQPAISHGGTELYLARFNGSVWTNSIVPNSANMSYDTSLAFGPDGQPAISYVHDFDDILEPPYDELYIARFNGSVWTNTTVDQTVYLGSSNSLAFGPDGQPAISYFDKTNQDLKIARFNGSAWVKTIVDSEGSGPYTLAFGPDGQPAISYNSGGELRISRFNGSNWISSVVDFAGSYASLAFGPDGQPAVSYQNGGLKFARKGVFFPTP